ncbi:hypothetical protein, partial [Vibrio vulnificus]|uniref:hypothetical protein n=1 Tax=Vibrio vulnificus TaxID=672 RepID=UPI001C66246A
EDAHEHPLLILEITPCPPNASCIHAIALLIVQTQDAVCHPSPPNVQTTIKPLPLFGYNLLLLKVMHLFAAITQIMYSTANLKILM